MCINVICRNDCIQQCKYNQSETMIQYVFLISAYVIDSYICCTINNDLLNNTVYTSICNRKNVNQIGKIHD